MARFDKLAVLKKIGETGMVPVFYDKDAEVAKQVVKACYDGGVRAFEFTNRGDFAHEVFEEVVKFAAPARRLPACWRTKRYACRTAAAHERVR